MILVLFVKVGFFRAGSAQNGSETLDSRQASVRRQLAIQDPLRLRSPRPPACSDIVFATCFSILRSVYLHHIPRYKQMTDLARLHSTRGKHLEDKLLLDRRHATPASSLLPFPQLLPIQEGELRTSCARLCVLRSSWRDHSTSTRAPGLSLHVESGLVANRFLLLASPA